MDERQAVTAANEAFYRAFETLEIEEMEKVWLRASYIKCVHPGWPLLRGWGPIMTSWERIFANTFGMRFRLNDVHVEVSGSLGWVVLIEDLEARGYEASRARRFSRLTSSKSVTVSGLSSITMLHLSWHRPPREKSSCNSALAGLSW